ncbi:MAG TPA: hypothetical protein DCR55_17985 [Lentisphaeria bacterium]|jgi:hypothetical protein|nr:hypothetical protein [Lentisphaeria bacterium]
MTPIDCEVRKLAQHALVRRRRLRVARLGVTLLAACWLLSSLHSSDPQASTAVANAPEAVEIWAWDDGFSVELAMLEAEMALGEIAEFASVDSSL